MTELQLVESCKSQKVKAQKLLYERYDERMFRLCYRYVSNAPETEEVLLNGFYKVLTKISKFEYRGDGSLEKWIRRIMVNEALMFLRKRKQLEVLSETAANNYPATDKPDGDITAEDLYLLISRLPTGYRTVFNLFAIEGFSHKEIAGKLGISENTSKSQLSKARSQLKKWLRNHGFEGAPNGKAVNNSVKPNGASVNGRTVMRQKKNERP